MSRMKFEGLLENEFTLSDKVLRSKNGTDSGVIDVPVENLILDEENITIFGDFNQDSIDSLSKASINNSLFMFSSQINYSVKIHLQHHIVIQPILI